MKYLKTYNESLAENIYYHGTTLPKTSPDIDKFRSETGYRGNTMLGSNRKVKSPWVFFTDDSDMARKYGETKTEYLYHDKGDFTNKTVVLKYDIDETLLKILDLTTKDYELNLKNIGIDLIELYGIGMFKIDDMWDLLDDDEISNTIIENGYDAVKLVENNGTSLAIHINKVNDIINKLR
jgi:hypothetical protein